MKKNIHNDLKLSFDNEFYLSKSHLASLTGGEKEDEEDEWVIVLIDGKPVKVRRTSDGVIIEIEYQ